MFPGLFGGCGGPGLGLWSGSCRSGWGSDFGLNVPGRFGGPGNFGCGCGCGTPANCGCGCGIPFGFGFGAGNCGCGNCCGCDSCGCGCGFRWCECEACNPLGGYGDGPCGGYVSFRDRFGFGCGC